MPSAQHSARARGNGHSEKVCVRVFQKNRTKQDKERKRFTLRYQLTWLWRLRSPTVCHMQTEDPEKLVVPFKGLKTRSTKGKINVPAHVFRKREIQPSSTYLFYSDPQQIRWCPLTVGRVDLPYSAHQFQCQKRPHRHVQKKTLNQLSEHPIAQSR